MKSRSLLSSLSAVAVTMVTLGFASQAQAQIINGDFENPNVGVFNNNLTSIPGWSGLVGFIELGTGSVYGIDNTTQVLELDAQGNSTVQQSIAGLTADTYTLSFDYARRSPSNSIADNSSFTFDVLWNGNVVGQYGPTSTFMTTTTLDLSALDTQDNTLAFRGTGTSDTFGALIDNVGLVKKSSNAIPEPGSVALLLGLAPVAGMILRRRAR